MKKLGWYIKYFLIALIITGSLTMVSSFSDFYLTKSTSNIINIGISKKAINEGIPKVIRRSEMLKLTQWMSQDEKNVVFESYSFVNNKYQKYTKLYPALKEEAIYLLNEEYNKNINSVMETPILITTLLTENPIVDLDEEINITELKESERLEFKENFVVTLNKVKRSKKEDAVHNYIKDAYKSVGVNIFELQKEYTKNAINNMIVFGILSFSLIFISIIFLRFKSRKQIRDIEDIYNLRLDLTTQFNLKEDRDINTIKNIKKNKYTINFSFISFIYFITLFILTIKRYFNIYKVETITLICVITIILLLNIYFMLSKKEKNNNKFLNIINKINHKMDTIKIISLPLIAFGLNGLVIFLTWNGYVDIKSGTMIAYIVNVIHIALSFIIFISISSRLKETITAYSNLTNLLPTELRKIKSDEDELIELKGTIEFKNISYKKELESLTFKIKNNNTTVIVDSDNKLEKLITSILLKFYDQTSGDIIIDEVNAKKIPIQYIRKNIEYLNEKTNLDDEKILYIINDDTLKNRKCNELFNHMNGYYTILLFSKDINILEKNDNIILIKDGKLIDEGNHNKLLKNEYYKEFIDKKEEIIEIKDVEEPNKNIKNITKKLRNGKNKNGRKFRK